MFKENKKARYSTLCIEKHLQLHLFFFFLERQTRIRWGCMFGERSGSNRSSHFLFIQFVFLKYLSFLMMYLYFIKKKSQQKLAEK